MDPKHEAAIVSLEKSRMPTLKALVIGEDTTPSNVEEPDAKQDHSFSEAGALVPPHDPLTLCMLLEHSNALRQNIDAYQNNIDGFGHRYEPVIDPNTDDGMARIANAMYIDAVEAGGDPATAMPSDEEVEEKAEWLRLQMRLEKARLKVFFEYCCPETSFIEHRKHTRQDLEVMGNGYWEVLRNKQEGDEGLGTIVQFVFIPGHTMRLMPLRAEDVQTVEVTVPISELSDQQIPAKKQFRRYVQSITWANAAPTSASGGKLIYFKEFGDPRTISSMTGKTYPSIEALKTAEKHERAATEVMHFSIHSPRTSYGVPRWMGTLLSVLGNRQAEEVNFMYFENKSIPPLAILVSGGRMTDQAVSRITDFVDNEIRGKKNFHKILVLEADSDSPANSGKTKIELKPLTDAQQQDGLFQNYDERNIDKVGQAFRLPRMLRGDIRDFNRSTAEAALVFAEMQVFQPEREEFDWTMNRKVLSSLGIKYWKFASMGPVTKDQKQLAEIVSLLTRNNIITPGEARVLAEDVLNKDLPKIEEFWAEQPVILTQQGFIPEDDFVGTDDNDDDADTRPGDAPVTAAGNAKADTNTPSLSDGGAKQPGQGDPRKKPRRRFRRVPPATDPTDKTTDVLGHATELVYIRDKIRAAETLAADAAFKAGKDLYESEQADDVPDDS